jgi:hypothetical protein
MKENNNTFISNFRGHYIDDYDKKLEIIKIGRALVARWFKLHNRPQKYIKIHKEGRR